MNPVESLRKIPLFLTLTPEALSRLSESIRSQLLKKGEVLFRRGSEGSALYIIGKGRIKISLSSEDGDEVTLAIFSDGDFFGEMSLLDDLPRSADAVALETSELLVLNRTDFLAFLKNNADALQSVLRTLSLRLRKTDDLLEDTCFLNVSARFAKKLVELAELYGHEEDDGIMLDLDMSQKELASMVGATRESINKELRTLREKGLVCTKEKNLIICNLDLLKRRIH
ncbi:MAG: Crp/Fnr family transcriptional regulator [Pseudomonadota bacterium]